MQNSTNASVLHSDVKLKTQLQRNNVYRDYRIRILSNSNSRLRQLSSSKKSTSFKSNVRLKRESNSKIPEIRIYAEPIATSNHKNRDMYDDQPISQINQLGVQGMIWNEPIYKFASPGGIMW